MRCGNCGKSIEDHDAFCPFCGMPAGKRQTADVLAGYVAAAREGHQDAIAALYEATYSKVYYTVTSMVKDKDAVADIVQDAYIKAFTHLDRFEGNTKFLPWVRQIAANTARDWLKRKRPMLFTELIPADEPDTAPEEWFVDERSENIPEQVIDQQETVRLVQEILEELPEDQRAVIGMFYYEGMSVKEIAAAMGASESAVKSRLLYGRKKIEKKVKELEKQGTRLYGLAPIPFLLLLLRNQEAHAEALPDGQILRNTFQRLPQQGSAAAVGGLGAIKGIVIALAVAVAIGLGALILPRLAPASHEPPALPAQTLTLQATLPQTTAPRPQTTTTTTPTEPITEATTPAPENTPTPTLTEAAFPTDGDRIVLSGTIGTYRYDEVVALQGQPDPNSQWADKSQTFRLIVLDTPETLTLRTLESTRSGEVRLINVSYAEGLEPYDGQAVIFSIDPAKTYWPSDTSLPLGQPSTVDVHVLD